MKTLFFLFFASIFCQLTAKDGVKMPNVLMVVIDDLRPELGCFEQSHVISPNIDRLAQSGMVFTNAFCNVAVCGASRASLLTGIRPSEKRFLSFHASADMDLPGHLSLPRYLKQNGYITVSLGKVYHQPNDDLDGWSIPPFHPISKGVVNDYLNQDSKDRIVEVIRNKNVSKCGPAWEIGDVKDDYQYMDGMVAQKAINMLDTLKNTGKPFFLALGFIKPHLPFTAPKKYYDLYKKEDIALATNTYIPENAPSVAIHNSPELRFQYCEVPEDTVLPDDYARSLRHGYFACVSYVDALLGEVMQKLKNEGLEENTIVVLWGDHGWNLGEHTMWCKHSVFNTSVHAPVIVSAPGFLKNKQSNSLIEYVDLYPTIVDLCGLPAMEKCQGKSFVPILKKPETTTKDAVFCRWQKGESIRTLKYAYSEWRSPETGEVTSSMLYDLEKDPNENVNVANLPKYASIVKDLSSQIKKSIATR